jgi:NAD(P)H dehydrogenase (quinone)
MKNKILVTGATGYQGNAVIQELLKQNFSVSALVSPNKDTKDLENQNVEIFEGRFEDVESLKNAFQNANKVVLSFPLLFDEKQLLFFAENVVNAWKSSNVELIVFNTNLPVYSEKVDLVAFDAKLAIEHYFDKEKLPYISLRPTLYKDNLSAPFLLPVIQNNGILPYPVPAKEKIAWISHVDLAKFIVEAIKHPELKGKKFNIGGVELLTGEEMAETISKYAGKPIHFVPVSADDFELQIAPAFGNETAKEIANIYRFVKDNITHLQVQDLKENTLKNLPISLETFDDWASKINW